MKKSSHGKSLKISFGKIKESIISALFPENGSCAGCGRVLLFEEILCGECESKLTEAKHFCRKCGRITYEEGLCYSCRSGITKWDRAFCLYVYDFPADEMIWHMKYRAKPHIAKSLGRRLGESLRNSLKEKFDIITFIPSSAERISERGYNQAELLAEEVGKILGIPVVDSMSASDSAHQVGLDAAGRAENAVSRFSTKTDVAGKRIIIIDDVMTTGSTMAEAAGVLKDAGCEYILAATVAQTVKSGE